MTWVAIGLGSNLGDRKAFLLQALGFLRAHPAISDLRVSRFRETDPVGGPPQGKFLNAVAVFRTELSPEELFAILQSLEAASGRVRAQRNGPRTLDLDLLLFGAERIDLPHLQIPHPRMAQRPFVLEPLAEVWPREEVSA